MIHVIFKMFISESFSDVYIAGPTIYLMTVP